jgi:hypothetical protein
MEKRIIRGFDGFGGRKFRRKIRIIFHTGKEEFFIM